MPIHKTRSNTETLKLPLVFLTESKRLMHYQRGLIYSCQKCQVNYIVLEWEVQQFFPTTLECKGCLEALHPSNKISFNFAWNAPKKLIDPTVRKPRGSRNE